MYGRISGCKSHISSIDFKSEGAGNPHCNIYLAEQYLSSYFAWILGAIDSASTTMKSMLLYIRYIKL
ncbi:hypothetical protein BJX96DRAFT_160795 [Aspergillus floccosus]